MLLLQVKYYPSADKTVDAQRSFEAKNLVVFSNRKILSQSPHALDCNSTANELPCLTSGCFTVVQKCDGVEDCSDGYDESDCEVEDATEAQQRQIRNYRLSRQSRFEDFYDVGDGDWGWVTANIDEDGEQFYTLPLPETPDDFFFHAAAVSKEKGVGVMEEPVVYSTVRPVDFYCEGPPEVHRYRHFYRS